mmetsp:Transcript_14964/g.27039  ORF Transcript_14964/g.27039 Transcript_14964/m.27039 type:complete len:98 (+) Transcript_14964:105-398(+)
MVQNNMEVIRDCSMTEERQKVIVDWFSQQNHNEHSGPLEAATWLKRVFGGSYMGGEQEGTFDKHWTYTYCISAEEDCYWMELAIGDEWYYLLFRIKA